MQNLRFDRHPNMKYVDAAEYRALDKNRQDYMKFRSEWRKGYMACTNAIREARAFIQENKTEHARCVPYMQEIQTHRIMARSMMLSLEALKIQRDFDRNRNFSRLERRAPVATKARTHYKPSDEEIEQRRAAKREKLAAMQKA